MTRRWILSILMAVHGATALAQEPPQPPREEATPATETRYTVEVLVRPTLDWAKRLAEAVRRQLPPEISVRVEARPPRYAVRVGDFTTLEEAQAVLEQVQGLGYEDASIASAPIGPPGPEWEERGTRTDAERPQEPPAEAVEPVTEEVPPGEVPPAPAPEEAPPPPGKRIPASRIDNGALALDGRLEDAAWSSTEFVSDFQQKGGRGGFPTRERTEVAILYDDDALYVGARMHMSDRASIRARRGQRDDDADADRLIVSLDTYRNRQTAYNFGVTAGGARIDYYQPQDVFMVRDYTFDPVWQAQTVLHEDGWTAEMRIPFSSLRFYGGTDSQVWGINVQRVSPALRLYAFWVVVPGDETAWASRFGDLVGLDGVRPHRRVAVIPYVAGQRTRSEEQPANGPFGDDEADDLRYGGDFLMDLSPGLSLEATINPDFGQIEADPAVVNLSAYEVFFPERRPFFLEGAQLFEGLGPRYFYSRRVGAPPHGRANAPFSELPVDTTIAGAAKVIGRRPSGWSTGSLLALTEEEDARTFDPETGQFGRVPVEPRTAFGVSRVQRDFGAGSSFGFGGTGVWRDVGSHDALEALLPRQAFAGGADWNLRFAEQSHELRGFVGASMVEGDPAAILRLQSSSARYLQRPDADHVGLDPTRDSLEGYTAGLRLGRIRGPLRWVVSGEARSPGFEINDAGAMATADDISAFGSLSYYTTRSQGAWRRLDVSASLSGGWNFGSVRQYTTPQVGLQLISRGFWRTNVDLAYDTRALSDSLTRGGPLMETGAAWRSQFNVSTNEARQWVWSIGGSYAADELDGWGYGLNTRILLRFADRFTLSVTPGYERSRNTRQFYTSLAGDQLETFNQRYVFATLTQRTAYARLRMGVQITPSLGFDLYVEPFAAVGSYDRFGELAAARSSDLRLYGTDGTTITRLEDGSYVVTDGDQTFPLADGDFDLTSLRGNAVLRWDYARGSTLYLVWAQTRDDQDVLGEQIRPGDLLDVFDAPVRDVFALKVSYRLDFD
ncbi:MAG: DUF5916 domain-containing protein [Thermoanaerobaculia bacterium]